MRAATILPSLQSNPNSVDWVCLREDIGKPNSLGGLIMLLCWKIRGNHPDAQ